MSLDLALMDLSEVASAIAGGHTSSVAVTEACLRRIHEWQPALNCFIRLDEDAALQTARERDRELARGNRRGCLHGVPLAHKDLFYRAGRISTAGSQILRTQTASVTATVLQKLDDAGAIDLGTLNMSEFAAGPTGHNVHFGNCHNTFDQDHVAGGSSSGSAAAVAARLVFGALGTDTGASIRVPAAVNGVTGLKPTYGRVSRYGVFPRSWSLDHVGPLARTARDCALLLQVIAGRDPHDSTTSDRSLQPLESFFDGNRLDGLRIGVPEDAVLGEVHAEIAAALLEARKTLERLGAKIRTVPFPDPKPLYFVAETLIKSESAAIHRKWLNTRKQDYAAHVRVRIEAGLYVPATQYIDALRLRTLLTERFLHQTMAEIDLLYLPLVPFPVPTIAETDVEQKGGEEVLGVVGRMTQFTRPINLLGLPALSVPCGFCSKGLPIAFQLVGHPFDEAALLRAADAFQQVTDYHRRVPVLRSAPAQSSTVAR